MKKAYLVIGCISAFATLLLVWMLRGLPDKPRAEKTVILIPEPSLVTTPRPAQASPAIIPDHPKSSKETSQRVIELKKRYPQLTGEEIETALRQGIRLERLEQAPPEAIDLKIVTTAFEQFKEAFGTYPQGDNIEMAKALLGENPTHTVFLDNYKKRFTNSSGALADTWKTPLRIEVTPGKQISIRSAGPDLIFWNADDVLLH